MAETEVQLTIQDGLSELKLINQKLYRNNQQLKRYSSKRLGEPDIIENQKNYVISLRMKGNDLLYRYLAIKIAIQKKNLVTYFEFDSNTYSLAEAIIYKQGLLDMHEEYTNSMDDSVAKEQIRQASTRVVSLAQLDDEQLKALKMVPQLFYSEEKKQKTLDGLLELRANLDRLIDKANHVSLLDLSPGN